MKLVTPYPAHIFALQISALYVYYIQVSLSRQYICPANICFYVYYIQVSLSRQNICPANICICVYYIQVSLIPPIYLPCKYLHFTSTTFKLAYPAKIFALQISAFTFTTFKLAYPSNIFALQLSALYVYYIQVSLSRQYICPANICILRLLHSS